MQISRRTFIISTAAAAVLPLPAVALPTREPFVEVCRSVSFLYFEDWARPSQPATIGAFVEHVGDWNGRSYPIVLSQRFADGRHYWDGVDAEWAIFHKEMPGFRWGDVPADHYPNIHSFVREKRFGEDPLIMRDQMERNRLNGGCSPRGTVPTRKTKFA